MAADTVPECSTSSPMLGPWLTPENTQLGPSGMSAPIARRTQSVGSRPPGTRRPSGDALAGGDATSVSVRFRSAPDRGDHGDLSERRADVREQSDSRRKDAIVVRDEDAQPVARLCGDGWWDLVSGWVRHWLRSLPLRCVRRDAQRRAPCARCRSRDESDCVRRKSSARQLRRRGTRREARRAGNSLHTRSDRHAVARAPPHLA